MERRSIFDIEKNINEEITKRETEPLKIAAENNVISTTYIKTKIDNTQENNKCRICVNEYETIDKITTERCKLSRKENKISHD